MYNKIQTITDEYIRYRLFALYYAANKWIEVEKIKLDENNFKIYIKDTCHLNFKYTTSHSEIDRQFKLFNAILEKLNLDVLWFVSHCITYFNDADQEQKAEAQLYLYNTIINNQELIEVIGEIKPFIDKTKLIYNINNKLIDVTIKNIESVMIQFYLDLNNVDSFINAWNLFKKPIQQSLFVKGLKND